MSNQAYMITRNPEKLMTARLTFKKYGIAVKQITKEYPEIQADSSIEIARYASELAAKEFKVPTIREDHSLFINALGGFPGPYTSYFEKRIPAEKILELLKGQKGRSCYFDLAVAFSRPNAEAKEYSFREPITICDELRAQ